MSSLQQLPQSAEVYARAQRAEIGAAAHAVKRIWSGMGENFDSSFLTVGPHLLAVLDEAQLRVATGALEYVPTVLADTGQTRSLTPRYDLDPRVLVGTAGDGLPTEGLAYEAVITAKSSVKQGASVAQALRDGSQFLTAAVGTLLSDTGRTAEKVAMNSRPVTGYVRMLNPPSCGRCVVLAGKRSKVGVAFDRHPKCDCRNIPASESIAGDLLVDPRAHLDSLSDDELAKTLGSRANAQAYRDGADMNQLINAYRKSGGVSTAQVFGRTVKYTTEATTKRGLYGRAARAVGRDPARTPRLMPESIYQIATSKADADRLLQLYGWIT